MIFNVVRSPNYNPIEGVFAKIKHNFKKNQNFDKNSVVNRVIDSIKMIGTLKEKYSLEDERGK